MVNTESNIMQEVNRRINIARTSVKKMNKIWKSKAVNYKLKLRLVRSTAFAIASCGSESWTFSGKVQKKLNAFEMWTYRRILRVSWKDKRTNEWVLQKLRTKMMLFEQVTSRKLRFFGHAVRHDGLEKTIVQGKVKGTRGTGRPTHSVALWHRRVGWMQTASSIPANRAPW